jgi:hypothetical protein
MSLDVLTLGIGDHVLCPSVGDLIHRRSHCIAFCQFHRRSHLMAFYQLVQHLFVLSVSVSSVINYKAS